MKERLRPADRGLRNPNSTASRGYIEAVESPLLGKLTPDARFADWLVSAPVAVTLLRGKPVAFILEAVENDRRPAEFHAAVAAFLALADAARVATERHVFALYRSFADDFKEEYDWPFRIAEPSGVWPHVDATEVRVKREDDGNNAPVYVQVAAECDWEVEHGLQLVYSGGNVLTRVSTQDGWMSGADAYDLSEEPPLPGDVQRWDSPGLPAVD